MKTLAISVATSLLASSLVSSGARESDKHPDPIEAVRFSQLDAQNQSALTNEEVAGLLFMREEEKLSQNVYSFLAKKWGPRPFGNILQAEAAHTAWVSALLKKYQIADPSAALPPGKFADPTLQKLYNELEKQGSISRIEALKVGATVEDVDLYDLNRWAKTTTRADHRQVYENLARGSRNHLRAFVRNLSNSGFTYKPKYISQEEFNKVISSPNERGGGF
jgi:hypothetical protein